MPKFGIDISRFQGMFNLTQAKAEGVQFVIARVGGADDPKLHFYKDRYFENFYQQSRNLNMPCGCYYLFNAYDQEEAILEAQHFLELIKGKKFEYPICLDIEGAVLTQPKENLIQNVIACADYLEKAGYFVALYASASPFNNCLNDARLDRFTYWVASYTKKQPTLSRNRSVAIWQYGGGSANYLRSKIVAGVVCDQNFSYVDFPPIIISAGLNGYVKERTHVVARGETLTEISIKEDVPVDDIVEKNSLIYPGQILKL